MYVIKIIIIGCDDPLPSELLPAHKEWLESLNYLNAVSVNRCYKPSNFSTVVSVELHSFSDASWTVMVNVHTYA